MHCSRNCRCARDIEYYKWRKGFLNKRRRDFITSVLKDEEGSTYDAIGDAAYCEHVVELENEHDSNFSIMDIPVEEMEDVYTQMLNDRDALRDATTALASAPLLNEPAADEEVVV
jgi:hypothetical protein